MQPMCGHALQCCCCIQSPRVYLHRSPDRSAAVAGPLLKAQTTLQSMPTLGLHRQCSCGERRATSASRITMTSRNMMDEGGSRLPRGLDRPPRWRSNYPGSLMGGRCFCIAKSSAAATIVSLESFVDWMRLALGKRELPEQFRIAC